MDDSPRQFIDELKFAIVRRRVGQIALAVVLAEACIRFLSAIVWYLIIPTISSVLEGHTESVLFQTYQHRGFAWMQLMGATLEFITAVIFVFYVNRWIYGRNRPRRQLDEPTTEPLPSTNQESPEAEEYEPIVPRLLSAPEAPKDELVTQAAQARPSDQKLKAPA